jgi:hypothetical protein
VEALLLCRERGEKWGNGVEILSGIFYWLVVWILVSMPASLVLAQLLKAASEQLQREESERLLGIHRSRQNEGRRSAIRRSAPAPWSGRVEA